MSTPGGRAVIARRRRRGRRRLSAWRPAAVRCALTVCSV